MKVLLINPHGTDQSGFISPSPGLLYIAGTLIEHSINVRFIDGCLQGKPAIVAALNEYQPDLVGISCLTLYRKRSLEIAALVKQLNPDTRVVLGGPHASIMYEQLLFYYPDIDCVVIGEGEITFLEIAQGKNIADIDGVAYLQEGRVVKTPPRKFVENLDDLPFPAWHFIDFKQYHAMGRGIHNGVNLAKVPRVPVVFSRGCRGHCDYCSSWRIWRKWRRRSPENMADELELLYHRYGMRHFCFVDDAMSVDRQATFELCDEIIARGLKIAFHITTRTDDVDKALLFKLKAAGCYQIAFGIETGSPRMLKKIFKENNVETSERAIIHAKNAGIKVTALIMVGNIGETKETINDTLMFLKKTQPDEIASGIGLYIMPGTKLYSECKKQGIIGDEFWLTDEPYQLYTNEYSQEELTQMFKIVSNYLPTSKKIQGRIKRLFEKYILRAA